MSYEAAVLMVKDFKEKYDLTQLNVDALAQSFSLTQEEAQRAVAEGTGHTNGHSPDSAVNLPEQAFKMASLGIPIELVESGTKACRKPNWENTCTSDVQELANRSKLNPSQTNYAMVAKATPEGYLFLDDDGGIRALYETHAKMQPTLKNQSQSGAFHYIYRHSPASLALYEKLHKAYISEPKPNGEKGEFWSLRLHNAYIIGAGSVFEGNAYKVAYDAPIIPIPDHLLNFLVGRYEVLEEVKTVDSSEIISQGKRNVTLTSFAGRLRNAGAEYEEIYSALSRKNHLCTPPLDDSDVQTISRSVARYPVGQALLSGGLPIEIKAAIMAEVQTATAKVEVEVQDQYEVDRSLLIEFPKFPFWVMRDTSLYKGLVEPSSASTDRAAEASFMAGVVFFLNYIALKVKIKGQLKPPTLFLGIIGEKSTYKSGAVEMAARYFKEMGCACSAETPLPGKRSLILAGGSAEGIAREMKNRSCRNIVLWNDELAYFFIKAGIDKASLMTVMLQAFDAGTWSNPVKRQSESFNFEENSYCSSWIWATTTQKFPELWSQTKGDDSGLNDRLFAVALPEPNKDRKTKRLVEPVFDTKVTRTNIEIAVALKEIGYDHIGEQAADQAVAKFVDRSGSLLERLALYFAVDTGSTSITDDHIERALALVKYRNEVLEYLDPPDGDNELARLQESIIRYLRRKGGEGLWGKLRHDVHADRKGTELWDRAIVGLEKALRIRLENRCGERIEWKYGRMTDQPSIVKLLKA